MFVLRRLHASLVQKVFVRVYTHLPNFVSLPRAIGIVLHRSRMAHDECFASGELNENVRILTLRLY